MVFAESILIRTVLPKRSCRTEDTDHWWNLLWNRTGCCQYSAAMGHLIYDGWKSRIHHSYVYCDRAAAGVFIGKKVRPLIIGCVAIAVVGFYFLCMTESLRLGLGDFLVLLCAIAFSIHILVIDHFSPKVDGVKMSAIQFLTAAIISAVPTLLWEQPVFTEILQAWQPVLYAGVMSCGVAYTLQIIAQKNADPTVASLLLSLESVFSVLAGWVLLGQGLSLKEMFGCVLIFCAIILAQLPEKKKM